MAGAACKVIIDNGVQALMRSLESILTNPDLHGGRIPENDRQSLIQELANIDIYTYSGKVAGVAYRSPGLVGVLLGLQAYGLVTDEVWEVYRRPVEASA